MKHLTRAAVILGMAAILGVLPAPRLSAQSTFSGRSASAGLTVGASFEGGASMIIQPPDGYKVGPIFAFRFGADATYALTPVVSAGLELGLDSRGTKLRGLNNSDFNNVQHLSYFSIYPSFGFGAFRVGVNMGVPLGGSTVVNTPSSSTTTDLTSDEFSKVEFLLEPRIGAVIPLLDDDTGVLSLSVMGGFSLNEMSDRGNVSGASDIVGDFHMVAGHIGISYQLGIEGTRKK
ncbi:MAG: hypothetical protein JWQ98_2656 [Chlorobi bacterium]|nr:hypothetical protein [Chlorobiota bacterium]